MEHHRAPEHVVVLLGPTRSEAARDATTKFTSFHAGRTADVDRFVFPLAARDSLLEMLQLVSRVRKITIEYGSSTLSPRDYRYNHVCDHQYWIRDCPPEPKASGDWRQPFGCLVLCTAVRPALGLSAAAIREAFGEGMAMASTFHCGRLDESVETGNLARVLDERSRTKPTVPSDELLSLGSRCGTGDWDGLEAGHALLPHDEQTYLDIFHGTGFQSIAPVNFARHLALLGNGDDRRVAYEVAARLGVPHWTIVEEVAYGVSVGWSERQLLDMVQRARSVGAAPPLVWVQTSAETCATCKRLYLEGDGVTPRIFRSDELAAPGSNQGRPLYDWRPTRPPLHMTCNCWLSELGTSVGLYLPDFEASRLRVTRLPSLSQEPLPPEYMG